MDKDRIRKRLVYWEETYDHLTSCYQELIKSGVQSYEIDDRALTRFNIPNLRKAIEEAEANIDKYENMLNGHGARKIVGIVPRDW